MADREALEQDAWRAFVAALGDQLAATWPAMPERLGERYAAFIEHAVQQAQQRGLTLAAGVARFVNLVFVWGPSFHDKPGFEWALGLLAAPREREWATVHQLVRRSIAELERRPEARISAATLRAADDQVCRAFGGSGRHGAMLAGLPAALPLAACDLEAAELRLLDGPPLRAYRLQGDDWQRTPLDAPAPLRIDSAHPAPPVLGMLSRAPADGPAARLQLRARAHASCGAAHPALRLAGSMGLDLWSGHETRALNFPVPALAQAPAPGGPGSAIAEETSPDIHLLELQVCGLRDDGDPLGSAALQVWAWPAAQWWVEVQRGVAPAQVVGEPAPARGTTRCRVECDGDSRAAQQLERGFADGLDAATGTALRSLRSLWQRVSGVEAGALDAQLTLLAGRAALSWGWQAKALSEPALMRVVGRLDMQAIEVDLQFSAELALEGTRSRLRLRCHGAVPLVRRFARETPAPTLVETLLPALERFRIGFEVELEPLASDTGALLQITGACSGALVGEAGLRPRTSGGSGWEWFAGLRLEPLMLPVLLTDPLLGQQRRSVALLPACTLLDWRLG